MNERQPSDEEVVEAIYTFAAQQMRDGASESQIEASLVQQGLDSQAAAAVVGNLSRMRSEAMSTQGRKNMLFGALWCIGGIVVTAGTYAAAEGGGTYVVAWGAIIFGAIQFFRGLAQAGG